MARSNIDTALRGYVDQVIHLHEERDEKNGEIREVYAAAKEAGFDTTILREIVREMRMDPEARAARYETLDDYRAKLGMLDGTPLGEAGAARHTASAERQKPARRGRGRPRKSSSVDDALDNARRHIYGGNPSDGTVNGEDLPPAA
jgi:uncharacterized protein (UPF0335 family)